MHYQGDMVIVWVFSGFANLFELTNTINADLFSLDLFMEYGRQKMSLSGLEVGEILIWFCFC